LIIRHAESRSAPGRAGLTPEGAQDDESLVIRLQRPQLVRAFRRGLAESISRGR